jgi:hypothetical protein
MRDQQFFKTELKLYYTVAHIYNFFFLVLPAQVAYYTTYYAETVCFFFLWQNGRGRLILSFRLFIW